MLDLQGIVDGLAQILGRAVAIDNLHVEMIVTSAQTGQIDEARLSAVLQRQTPSNIVGYVKSLKLEQREGPIHVPGPSQPPTLARICYPLRGGSIPLGYLWLINDPAMSEREIRIVEDTLPEITERLLASSRELQTRVGESSRLADQALVSSGPEPLIRAHELGLLPGYRQLAIQRSDVLNQDGSPASPPLIRRLVEDLVGTTYPGNFICTVNAGALTAFTAADDAPGKPLSFVSAARLSAKRLKCTLGGYGVAQLDSSRWEAAPLANSNARRALELSRSDPNHDIVRWEQAGIWKLLLSYDYPSDAVREISEVTAKLIATDPELAATLWIYFDSTRDVSTSCSRLHIHRATLYYRLKRIREFCGPEILDDGTTSLSAHLALQYWSRIICKE